MLAQSSFTAASNKLQNMGKKFNLPDTVFANFEIIAKPAIALRWASQHRFHIVHDRIIKRATPDKRLDLG